MKIKVLKTLKQPYHDVDSDTRSIIEGITNWDEVDDKKYYELKDAINSANCNKKDKFTYFLICQQEDYLPIFQSAQEYIVFVKKSTEQREEREKQSKIDAETRKIERKKKQLAKLQKELNGTR